MLQSKNTRYLKDSITVVGPSGETVEVTSRGLVDSLNETGYPWKLNGYSQNEIVVFFPSGTLELEVIY